MPPLSTPTLPQALSQMIPGSVLESPSHARSKCFCFLLRHVAQWFCSELVLICQTGSQSLHEMDLEGICEGLEEIGKALEKSGRP